MEDIRIEENIEAVQGALRRDPPADPEDARDEALCVCEIQHVLKGSQPNVSHHLKTLADAGWSIRSGTACGSPTASRMPRNPVHAAALALLRRSLKNDERVKKDRAVVKSVNRIEIALRK